MLFEEREKITWDLLGVTEGSRQMVQNDQRQNGPSQFKKLKAPQGVAQRAQRDGFRQDPAESYNAFGLYSKTNEDQWKYF